MAVRGFVGAKIGRLASVTKLGASSYEFPVAFLRENIRDAWDRTSLQRLSNNLDTDLRLVDAQPRGDMSWQLSFSDGATGLFVLPPTERDRSLEDAPPRLWSNPGDSVESLLEIPGSQGGLKFEWADLEIIEEEEEEGNKRTAEQLGSGGAVLSSKAASARCTLLERVHEFGIALLKDVPTEPDQGKKLAEALAGTVEGTNFGYTFTIKSVEDPHNLAFDAIHLQHHTDFTYCEKVPDVALFHCIRPADVGGNSLWLDGVAAALDLKHLDPDAFRTLVDTPVAHMDLTDKWLLRATHPTIEVASYDKITRIYFNERTRDSWRQWGTTTDGKKTLSPDFYASLRKFEALVEDESRHLDTPMRAGDLILFDNARVLHSRTAFSGERWMEGTYMDWSAARATWRSLRRRLDDDPLAYCGNVVGGGRAKLLENNEKQLPKQTTTSLA